ncbi:DUF1835 domain-containing protein [Cohnella thailandensis]|uniref:DUF1835 domain-containing protein n=1 Tax=Cohnella thailandensis TaxID=557557 RepID=A0A841T3F9_9BACL|nr:DUF1835 domain-containing protein [Cohnella thailandensis]MBP1977562.1 hypothetical protein [Cohnella thailandensis]
MLHIVNGDSVAEKLKQGVVQGEILVWREVYPHGPVFQDPAEIDNRAMRSQHLEQTLGIPRSEFVQISRRQEQILSEFHKYEEVVLWFEHDLFDQTMLCYLLHFFSERPMLQTKLSLLSIGEYPGIELFRGLGQLSVKQMETLSGTWKSVSAEELELGKAFWQAYTADNPQMLGQLLSRDTSALPFAHDAYRAHLARFPSTHNGLGIVEQTTLEMLHAGLNSPYELFKHVGDRLHTLGMGDLEYWHLLKVMSQDPYPLIQFRGLDCEAVLTDFGKSVKDGKEDWIAKRGIDRWYGGVHLQGDTPRWRWDSFLQVIHDSGSEV